MRFVETTEAKVIGPGEIVEGVCRMKLRTALNSTGSTTIAVEEEKMCIRDRSYAHLLKERSFAHFGHDQVGRQQEHQRNHRGNQAHRRGIAKARDAARFDALAVNIGGNHIRRGIGARRIHEQNLLVIVAQDARHGQDEQDHDRGQDARPRDVYDLLDAVRAVDGGGFV